MASDASSSSTKAAEVAPQRYEVFLSFWGPDTRHGFVSHLFNALDRQKIKTYIDDKSLERGNEIAYSLSRAIQESVVSIVVFSKKYASSWWCLDELVQILECKESHGQIVVPVFYHVEPTHVRKQKGSFGKGFSKLINEERFVDKVEKWKTTLTTASDLSGHTLSAQSPEADKVDEIVEDVKRKLYGMSQTSNDFKGLVGIEKRAEKIKSLLRLSTRDDVVRPIGVWGMGGIGKTTLATVVFENVKNQFQGCCFLANVREQWEKGQSENLKKKLHSDLLGEENPINVTKRLIEKRVFIVLDDIDNQHQLGFLVGDCSGFGNGSRIIVTTRNREMLRYLEAYDDVYKVEELNDDEALQLFLLNAFKAQSSTAGQYVEILKNVMNYAKGFPLALKVLGSFLRCKKKEDWKSYLNELIQEPPNEIQNVLKVSYDHGLDEIDQSIFLDIVCFLKGEYRDEVEDILDACYVSPNFSAKRRINNLIEKSLLTINKFGNLWMHDLLEEMGLKIASSPKEPGKRSRLWIGDEIFNVLKNNSGTETIEGINLLEDEDLTEEVDIGPSAFEGMHNLRYLRITQYPQSKIDFPKGLLSLPNALRYLDWHECTLESFPSKFSPQNLVELRISYCSNLKQLWSGVQLFEGQKPVVRTCLPGNEIPNWFRHQTNKSRITIKLRPNWQTNFIGFALCTIGWIECEYSFKTNDENFSQSIKFQNNFVDHLSWEISKRSPYDKDHLSIWYSYEEYRDYHEAFEISFKFSYHYRWVNQDFKRCGVRLLYRKDVENPNMKEILDDDIPELAMSDDDIPKIATSETSDDDISEISMSDEDILELEIPYGNEITESSTSERLPKRTRF